MRVTQRRLQDLIEYQPSAGLFLWKINRRGRFARIGSVAGRVRPDGYVRIGVDGELLYAHRVAWVLANGVIPDGMEVDHIDHNPSNNKLSNLRLVTSAGNNKNRSRGTRNTSGVTGVSWSENAHAWLAQITVNRRTRFLGYFHTIDAAQIERRNAEARLGFHHNHGQITCK